MPGSILWQKMVGDRPPLPERGIVIRIEPGVQGSSPGRIGKADGIEIISGFRDLHLHYPAPLVHGNVDREFPFSLATINRYGQVQVIPAFQ